MAEPVMASGAPLTPRHRAALIVIALVAQGLAYWSAPLLFSNDGPQHLLGGWVTSHIDDPGIAIDWLQTPPPLASHGYNEVFRLVVGLTGWRLAHAFTVWLPLAAALFGWLLLATREREGVVFRAGLLTACSLSWLYWIGLMPFLYGLSLVPIALMLAEAPGWRRVPALALLLLVQALCHPFTTMLTGGVLIAMALTTGAGAILRTIVVGIPAGLLAMLVRVADHGTGGETAWELEPDVFRQLFGQYLPGPQGFRVALFVFLVWVVACWWRGWASRTRRQRALFVAALAMCLITPVIPYTWLGWELVRARFIPVGLPLLVVFAPVAWVRFERWVMAPAAVIMAATYLTWTSRAVAELQTAYDDVYDALAEKMPRLTGQRWELAIFDMAARPDEVPEVDYYGGTAHMAQVLAVTAGGAPNFSQATDTTVHWMLYSRTPAASLGEQQVGLGESLGLWGELADEPRRRMIEVQSQLAHGFPHEVLIVAGTEVDGRAVADAGYDVTPIGRTRMGLHLYEARRRGCTVTFEVDAVVADVIEVGVLPRPGAVEAFSVPAGHSSTTFEALPCGLWWVRPGLPMSDEPRDELIIPMLPPGDRLELAHVVPVE